MPKNQYNCLKSHLNCTVINVLCWLNLILKINKYLKITLAIYDKNYTFESGDLAAWKKYQQDYLEPINVRFKTSKEKVFRRLRIFLAVEAITYWESWNPCELCGRPSGDGRRSRIGFCRLKIQRINIEVNWIAYLICKKSQF